MGLRPVERDRFNHRITLLVCEITRVPYELLRPVQLELWDDPPSGGGGGGLPIPIAPASQVAAVQRAA